MTAAWPEGLAESKYVLLTTFTRDGRPKPTPVWFALEGDRLIAYTGAESWKVKRIRTTPRVLVRACSARGRPTGPEAEGTARVLEGEAAHEAQRRVLRRYPVTGRLFTAAARLLPARRAEVANPAGLEVRLTAG